MYNLNIDKINKLRYHLFSILKRFINELNLIIASRLPETRFAITEFVANN